MQSIEDSRLQRIILKLERKYPFFKKMDVYSTVSDAYKHVRSIFKHMTDKDFDEVENRADKDLHLSI
jgi:transcription elongation factor Elf1